jgi:hypothetical protein
MAVRENNTMAEGLTKLMKQIADMKIMPDSDLEFLSALETDIISYLRPPTDQQAQPQGPPGMDIMQPAMQQVMGGGGGPGPGMPNPDEMRRMLATQ